MTAIKSDGGFERMLAMCKNLANGMPVTVIAPQVDAFLRGQIQKGETPEGQKWPLTVKGQVALRGAAAAFVSRIVGTSIVFIVKAPEAYHHFGAQGKPVRRQLPEGRMPRRLGDAIAAGAVDWFKAQTSWGKRGFNYYSSRGINPMNSNNVRRAA